MEKKPTNPYFSISAGKEKKYLNVVITSDEEATGNADAAAGSNIGNADAAADSNIGSAEAADSNIGNTGEADMVTAEGNQDQNFARVISVNALAPAKEILLTLPVQNISDEALASILSYIAQRDAVTDSTTYYGPLVTVLVRSRYSEDDVEAIVNTALMVQNMPSSCNEIEKRRIAAEFEDFLNFRLQCKARAKEVLSLMAEA